MTCYFDNCICYQNCKLIMVQKVFHSWLVDASKERNTAKVNICNCDMVLGMMQH